MSSSSIYCVCQQSDSGIMIECIKGTGGCNGWVHPSCCQLLLTQEELEAIDGYVCPMCEEEDDDYEELNAVNTEMANKLAMKNRRKKQETKKKSKKKNENKRKSPKNRSIDEEDEEDEENEEENEEEQEFIIQSYKSKDNRKRKVVIKDDDHDDDDDDEEEDEDEDDEEEEEEDDDTTNTTTVTVSTKSATNKQNKTEQYTEQPTLMVVERILASRPVKLTIAENSNHDLEYLIKWKGYSYMHASWESVETLLRLDLVNKQRIKRFDEKKLLHYRPTIEKNDLTAVSAEEEEEEYFNPDFLDVHRIIAKRVIDLPPDTITENNDIDNGVRYLVKWCQLPYNECTWERECDIRDETDAISNYIERCKIPPRDEWDMNGRKFPPSIKEYRKLETSPEYGNSERLYLREYQLEGLNWLMWNWYNQRSSILADEMGLGKTIQTLAFLNCMWKNSNIKCRGPFIVIAPLSLISQWQNECEIWTKMNCIVYHGNNEARQTIKDYEFYFDNSTDKTKKSGKHSLFKFHILVTTYEIAIKDISFLSKIHWRCMIVDEAHRLKNQKSRLVDQLKTIKRDHCVLLTGTPLQNKTEELWALLNFIDPKNFPTINTFLSQFGDLYDSKQVASLHKMLKPYILRRVKEDVEKSLPPKEETIIEVELTSIQKKWYKAIYEKNTTYLLKGSQTQNIPNLMNIMMELRKCCNHPYLNNGVEEILTQNIKMEVDKYEVLIKCCGKMVLLDKLLPKLKENGHKILIFSQMVRVLDILEDYINFKGYLYERLDGNIRGHERQAAVNRFIKEEYNRFIMLLSTKAGGLGLNLTAADTVIIYDSDWNPQNDLQAQARAHRIGQTHAVKIYRLITKKTYEMEMFHRASLKLGLDRAVLTHMRKENESNNNTKRNKIEEAKEINELLKKGAYNVFRSQNGENDEDKEAEEFCSANIDEILQRSTQVITYENEKKSNFSKASFISATTSDDVDLDDPDFWKKAIGLKEPEPPNEYGENSDLVIEGQRRRTRVTRFGITVEGEAEEDDIESNDISADEKEGEDKENNKKENIQRDWTANGRDRLQRALMHYGYGRWKIIRNQSGGSRTLQEIELCSRIFILHCAICCAEGLLVTNNQAAGMTNGGISGGVLDYENCKLEENVFIRSAMHVTQKIRQDEKSYRFYQENLPGVLKEEDFIAKLKANGAKRFLIRLDMLNRLQAIIAKACLKLNKKQGQNEETSCDDTTVSQPVETLSDGNRGSSCLGEQSGSPESEIESKSKRKDHLFMVGELDDMIERFGIKESCNAIDIVDIGERPSWTMITSWWNYECDRNLLLGVFLHGYGRVQQILSDPRLIFQEKLVKYQEDVDSQLSEESQMPEVQQINRLLGWLLSAEEIKRSKEQDEQRREQVINDQKRQRTIEIKQRQARIQLKKRQFYKEIEIEMRSHDASIQMLKIKTQRQILAKVDLSNKEKRGLSVNEKKTICYFVFKFGEPQTENDWIRIIEMGFLNRTPTELQTYYDCSYRQKMEELTTIKYDFLSPVAERDINYIDPEESNEQHNVKAYMIASLSKFRIELIKRLRYIVQNKMTEFLEFLKVYSVESPVIWWIPVVHDTGLVEATLKHGIMFEWDTIKQDTLLPFTTESILHCLQLLIPTPLNDQERSSMVRFPSLTKCLLRMITFCNDFLAVTPGYLCQKENINSIDILPYIEEGENEQLENHNRHIDYSVHHYEIQNALKRIQRWTDEAEMDSAGVDRENKRIKV